MATYNVGSIKMLELQLIMANFFTRFCFFPQDIAKIEKHITISQQGVGAYSNFYKCNNGDDRNEDWRWFHV